MTTPGRPSPRLRAIMVILAAALLAAGLEAWWLVHDLEQERTYQLREIQEGLSSLHRDLMTVNHLTAGGDGHHHGEVTEYLAARREAFAAVRWLGYLPSPEQRPKVMLSSSEAGGYDPRRDTAVAQVLGHLAPGEVAAAVPASHRNLASLALVLGSLDQSGAVLVALVDGGDLLDDSLRAMGPANPPLVVSWNGTAIGHWPHISPIEPDLTGVRRAVSVATLDFTVNFGAGDGMTHLRRMAPLPLAVLLTGLAVATVLWRRAGAGPVPPAAPATLLPRPATTAAHAHRARLWQLGELAASLSHDLGQPLNVIRLGAEAALDAADDGRLPPDRLRRTLSAAVDQTLRAQAMLDTVVAVTRRPAVAPTALAPVPVVRQVLADHLPQVKRQGTRLLWHAELDVPPLCGHADRLAAAVRALLANACEALATQRLDSGRPGTVHVRCRRQGDAVAIEVADDGPGFPAALGASLNEPDATAEGMGKGCGLGLAVALGVAAEMGGSLTIADARPGTRATLLLPPLRRSLLLAEDDTAAAAELAEALGARGWDVRVAHGGNAALALFLQSGADAVVTDLHMPDGDGWRLIERLRDHAPDLPIIAVSTISDGDGDAARRAVACGAAVVLRKPVAAREVAAELEDLLGYR